MGLNRWQGIGHLGHAPEHKTTQGGTSVCSLSLGCSESYKDNSGEWQQRTEWVKIVVWGKRADTVAAQCSKGDKVYIEGRLATRSYEDKNGNKRYVTEVVASTVEWWGGKKAESDSGYPPHTDDDVPF